MSSRWFTPGDVGRRVVVRYLLDDGSATDVLGELSDVGAVLAVQPDDGPSRLVAEEAVVAAKVVPPRAVRQTSSAEAVQRAADLGWPGLERRRLGGWVMRASGGFTGRANSVLAVGDPGVPVDAALGTVGRFYAERGLPPRVQVPFAVAGDDDPAPGLDTELAERGWTCDPPTLLMTVDLRRRDTGPAAPASDGPGLELDVAAEPDEAWMALYRYRGGGLPPVARAVLTAAGWQRFASLRSADGETVAVARLAVAEGWAGVTAMQVDDGHRRRGLGRFLLEELLGLGARHGARFGYLQVFEANAPAVALYRSAGFMVHHRYHYRTATDRA